MVVNSFHSQLNETPLHIAAKEGILPIVQTLCAFGCKLEILSRVCRKTNASGKKYTLTIKKDHLLRFCTKF